MVESYLNAYGRALRSKFENLWYIDAFAGTGARTVRTEARSGDFLEKPVPEQIEQRRGSAQIAIDVTPAFDRIIFTESKAKYCAALRDLAAKHPTRDIRVVEEDANRSIQNAIAWDRWQSTSRTLPRSLWDASALGYASCDRGDAGYRYLVLIPVSRPLSPSHTQDS